MKESEDKAGLLLPKASFDLRWYWERDQGSRGRERSGEMTNGGLEGDIYLWLKKRLLKRAVLGLEGVRGVEVDGKGNINQFFHSPVFPFSTSFSFYPSLDLP